MTKALYLDMDGTIADLYTEPNWLGKIRAEVPNLFRNLKPMYNTNLIHNLFNLLIEDGWNIEVITWTPMDATEDYHNLVATEKAEWIAEHFPMIAEVHALKYGEPKQKAIKRRATLELLADDNAEVRAEWETPIRRKSIDADGDLIEEIVNFLGK